MEIKLSVIIPVYNQDKLILKAINSISPRDDIEIIVIDDASTDETLEEIRTYQRFTDQNIIVLTNEKNMGVGYTVNRGYDVAQGEYVTLLGSDDYFYTNELNKAIELLDGTDIVYYDLKINNGDVWHLNEKSKKEFVGSTKFIKRSFLGKDRCPEIRYAEDKALYEKLLLKNPTEKFSNLVVKHYNFPRENSLCYLESIKE